VSRASWACHAYGEGPCAHLCFLQAAGPQCTTEQECDTRVVAERERVYARIQARAAQDPADELWAGLARDIYSPDRLLNGPQQDR